MSDDALRLEAADPQDLADLLCGLTALGGYAAAAGFDDDADRIETLRRRLIIENEALARHMLAAEYVTTGADPDAFIEGVREIVDGDDA